MAVYKPARDRKKAIEDILKDLDPATRELARRVLENMIKEEAVEIKEEEFHKHIEELKKKMSKHHK